MDYVNSIATHFPGVLIECSGPSTEFSNITWVGGEPMPTQAEVEAKHLNDRKLEKIAELSNDCSKLIIAGFTSSALGSLNWYDSEPVDQINLIGNTTTTAPIAGYPDGFSSLHACRPIIEGVLQPKIYLSHTHAQFRTIIADGVAFKLEKLQKFNDWRNYILANELTIAELDAIVLTDEVPSP